MPGDITNFRKVTDKNGTMTGKDMQTSLGNHGAIIVVVFCCCCF